MVWSVVRDSVYPNEVLNYCELGKNGRAASGHSHRVKVPISTTGRLSAARLGFVLYRLRFSLEIGELKRTTRRLTQLVALSLCR